MQPSSLTWSSITPDTTMSLDNANRLESHLATQSFNAGRHPDLTRTVPAFGFNQQLVNSDGTDRHGQQASDYTSMLAGSHNNQHKEPFHNNMQPFFKGSTAPTTNINGLAGRLDRFTGQDNTSRSMKTEVASFFDLKPNVTNPHGAPPFTLTQDLMSRYIPSQMRRNETPIEKIRVGPGIGAGFSGLPSGGLNQANSREYVMPKTTDQLRIATKPKLTYEGRVIEGMKESKRGLQAPVIKRRPQKWFHTTPERGTTTSAVKAAKLREKFYLAPTNKETTSTAYYGIGGTDHTAKPAKERLYRKSTKNIYKTPGMRNAHHSDAWDLNKSHPCDNNVNDYGRHGFTNRPADKLTVQGNIAVSNFSTIVKKLMAPILDILKPTRKEMFVGNSRPDGNFAASIPAKLTVHDPSDVARTTLKETMIDNLHPGFLVSATKPTVADSTQTPRTTLKELHIDNNAPFLNMNPQQPRCMRVYDPSDIARTTMKEILAESSHMGNLDSPYEMRPGGYISTSVELDPTNRSLQPDYYYIAPAEATTSRGMGYTTSSIEVDITNRQLIGSTDYIGIAQDSGHLAPQIRDAYYEAELNTNKEVISRGRAPGPQGPKVTHGMESINVTNERCNNINYGETWQPAESYIYSIPPEKNICGTTKLKPELDTGAIQDRLNPDILAPFNDNPYTHSLTNVAF
jgi:hypothetical protein